MRRLHISIAVFWALLIIYINPYPHLIIKQTTFDLFIRVLPDCIKVTSLTWLGPPDAEAASQSLFSSPSVSQRQLVFILYDSRHILLEERNRRPGREQQMVCFSRMWHEAGLSVHQTGLKSWICICAISFSSNYSRLSVGPLKSQGPFHEIGAFSTWKKWQIKYPFNIHEMKTP